MQGIYDTFDHIWERKNAFLFVFFLIYVITYGLLVLVDFVPNDSASVSSDTSATSSTAVVPTVVSAATSTTSETPQDVLTAARYPVRLKIDALGRDIKVLNPQVSSISNLDNALLEGAVRYPSSADFKNTGTIFLFGHSSYLPIVHNKSYQAFNGIQKLVEGDVIRLYSDDAEYDYHVSKVYKAKASDASITLEHDRQRLILVTCNSFGTKDDRFVVEAEFVEKKPL